MGIHDKSSGSVPGGNRYQFSRCNQCRFQMKMAVNKSRTYISASQITFFFPMEASNSCYNPILYGNVSADDLFRKNIHNPRILQYQICLFQTSCNSGILLIFFQIHIYPPFICQIIFITCKNILIIIYDSNTCTVKFQCKFQNIRKRQKTPKMIFTFKSPPVFPSILQHSFHFRQDNLISIIFPVFHLP